MDMDTPISWLDLPEELLRIIAKNLDTRIDILRFRSVCSSWHSSIPASTHNSCHFPIKIPFPNVPDASIFETTLYRIQPESRNPETSLGSSSGWLLKVDEDETSPGKLRLLNPLSQRKIPKDPVNFPKKLDFMEFRVSEICKEYTIKSASGTILPGIAKVLLFPNSAWDVKEECLVVAVYEKGELGYWKYGDEEWSLVDKDNSCYDDIIVYKGQFYVVDKLGTVSWIDSSMRLVQFSPLMCGGGDKKHLVEANGDLYVIDRYLGGERRSRHRVVSAETVDFKVYRLDQEWGKWDEIRNLGDLVFFLGGWSSFSVSVRDFAGCDGNCIYFTDNKYFDYFNDKICVLKLDDHVVKRAPHFPHYLQIIWPPPGWLIQSPCPLDPNCRRQQGFVKLNTDGSRRHDTGQAPIRGCIRDEYGERKGGFARKVGDCEVLVVELLAAMFGLKLCIEKGLTRGVVNLDSKIAVHLLMNSQHVQLKYYNLIRSCREFCSTLSKVVLQHFPREVKGVADKLASFVHDKVAQEALFEQVPEFTLFMLMQDLLGIGSSQKLCC